MISYSAVVLDEVSREKLINAFQQYIPEGWEVVAHHMTMTMGELPEEWKGYLGEEVTLIVEDFGMDDKVAAVGVSGFHTKNAKAHITLAVNRANGGKPFLSNKLTDWNKVEKLLLNGIVTEVER